MPQLTIVPHGDSAAVVLPAAFLELLGTRIGEMVEATPGDRQLVLSAIDDPERQQRLQEVTRDVFERRRDAYQRLAQGTAPMLFPRKEEVLAIHGQLIERFGGLPGIRDEGLLDSALHAAAQRRHYESADLATCAATFAFHLTRNHPFADGNKRVGAAVAEIFVQLNGALFTASNDEIVDLFMGIAAGAVSREEVERLFAGWVTGPPRAAHSFRI